MPPDPAEVNEDQFAAADILLLTVHMPEGAPLRLCGNNADFVSRGETWLAASVVISRPQDDGRAAEAVIEVPNIGASLANLIETIDEPVRFTIEGVFSDAPDDPYCSYEGLMLVAAELGTASARFTIRSGLPLDEPVSDLRATAERFPGVAYGF